MNHWKAHKPYWAIDMNTDEGHGLIGRWWFEDGRRLPEPPVAALRTATWHTRREALPYLKLARASLPHARLVRVEVKFEALTSDRKGSPQGILDFALRSRAGVDADERKGAC